MIETINLVKVEIPALEKLIEIVDKWFGSVFYKSLEYKKAITDATTQQYKAVVEAETSALLKGDIEGVDELATIKKRIVNTEMRRQRNLKNIFSYAASQLSDEKVSDKPINEDWMARFLNNSQDVSEQDLQKLWAQILAGEIKSPGSYSLRTLEILRNINKEEALLFSRVANFVFTNGNTYDILHDNDGALTKFGIQYDDFSYLMEIGVLQTDHDMTLNIRAQPLSNNIGYLFFLDKYKIIIKFDSIGGKKSLRTYSLSNSGREIYSLLTTSPNMEYVQTVAESIQNDAIHVSIEAL